MMRSCLAWAVLSLLGTTRQEEVRKLLEALKSDDISERERAMVGLKKTPLEQLKLLEPGLESQDPEFRSRVREAMTGALCTALGNHLVRFTARPVAPDEVQKEWAKNGCDPDKIPQGHLRIPTHGLLKGRVDADYVLVEKEAAVTNEHVQDTKVRQELQIGGSSWVTTFELTEEGAKRFDEAARKLYNQKPNPGMLALLVDGELVTAPAIRSPSFGGHGVITGGKTREECERTAALLRGKWFALSFRVSRESGEPVAVDDLTALVRKLPGFEQAECAKHGEKEVTVNGPTNERNQDLLNLWMTLRQKGYTLLPRRTEGRAAPDR